MRQWMNDEELKCKTLGVNEIYMEPRLLSNEVYENSEELAQPQRRVEKRITLGHISGSI